MVTKLALDIRPTSNTKTFRLVDDSQYNDKIETTEGYLEIIPPGFDELKQFKVKPEFNIILNTSILGILPAKTYKHLADLPDGLYQIKYSVPPTDRLNVEYNYFRTAKLEQLFDDTICKLYKNRAEFRVNEFDVKQKDLIWIKILMDSSRYAAEDSHDVKLAIELYNDAQELIQRITNEYCK